MQSRRTWIWSLRHFRDLRVRWERRPMQKDVLKMAKELELKYDTEKEQPAQTPVCRDQSAKECGNFYWAVLLLLLAVIALLRIMDCVEPPATFTQWAGLTAAADHSAWKWKQLTATQAVLKGLGRTGPLLAKHDGLGGILSVLNIHSAIWNRILFYQKTMPWLLKKAWT